MLKFIVMATVMTVIALAKPVNSAFYDSWFGWQKELTVDDVYNQCRATNDQCRATNDQCTSAKDHCIATNKALVSSLYDMGSKFVDGQAAVKTALLELSDSTDKFARQQAARTGNAFHLEQAIVFVIAGIASAACGAMGGVTVGATYIVGHLWWDGKSYLTSSYFTSIVWPLASGVVLFVLQWRSPYNSTAPTTLTASAVGQYMVHLSGVPEFVQCLKRIADALPALVRHSNAVPVLAQHGRVFVPFHGAANTTAEAGLPTLMPNNVEPVSPPPSYQPPMQQQIEGVRNLSHATAAAANATPNVAIEAPARRIYGKSSKAVEPFYYPVPR